MNLYHYTFFIFYKLLQVIKRNKPEVFASQIIAFLIACNTIELYFIYSEIRFGTYTAVGKIIMAVIFLLSVLLNHIYFVTKKKYSDIPLLYSKLTILKKYILNLFVIIYITTTIVFLFFVKE